MPKPITYAEIIRTAMVRRALRHVWFAFFLSGAGAALAMVAILIPAPYTYRWPTVGLLLLCVALLLAWAFDV